MSTRNHPVEQEELMTYLDGELAPDRAADTATHLEECAECRQLAADLREVSEMLTAWQIEEAEREPAKNVVEALKKRRGSPKSSAPGLVGWRALMNPLRWSKSAWGSAAVVLIAAVVLTPRLLHMRGSQYQLVVGDRDALGRQTAQGQLPAGPPPKVSAPRGQALYLDKSLESNGRLTPVRPSPSATPLSPSETAEEAADEEQKQADDQIAQDETSNIPGKTGPMIIRTAELEITTDAFEKARAGVDEILRRHNGHVGQLNVNTPAGEARSLTGTLRVPAGQLDAALADLKGLGRTEKESQSGEEVTQQYVDLEARLANAKHTEQRLSEMLRERTGKLSDVLAVEIQISRVRGEIEQMEAERKTMKNQVDFATITITLAEAYKEELKAVPSSTGTQFRNAAVDGYRTLVDGIIAVLLWLLSVGPTLLLWAAILFFPARMVWRRVKPRLTPSK